MSSWKKNKMTRWPSLDYFMYLVGQIKNHEHLKGLLSKQISKISYFSLHDWGLLKPGSTNLESSFMTSLWCISWEIYVNLFILFIYFSTIINDCIHMLILLFHIFFQSLWKHLFRWPFFNGCFLKFSIKHVHKRKCWTYCLCSVFT